MSSRKEMFADLLFGVQVILAFVFSIPQFMRLLENTNGQSLSMQIVMLGFLLVSLSLALEAHWAKPDRITRQLLAVYSLWSVFIAGNIGAIAWNGSYQWSNNDSLTAIFAGLGILAVAAVCRVKKVGIDDPISKGLLAVAFKAMPQLMMAFKVASEGGAGVPMVTVIVGNLTVCIRIGQILISIREAGWDRNRTWLLIGEAANELSWAAVSIVWAIWFYGS